MTKDEALKMAIEAMNSAYSSHGKILPSYPAQDAWMFHGCDAKLSKSLQACKEALEQHSGDVVVTKNEQGQIVCVTRQDAEGNILSVIAESEQPEVGDAEIRQMINDIEWYQMRVKELEEELEAIAQPARLVSYAPDKSTCTLNIDGEEVYFNREQPAQGMKAVSYPKDNKWIDMVEQPWQDFFERGKEIAKWADKQNEQPAQEPVAWMHRHAGEITEFNDFQSCQYCEPLYTHPAPSWQGLSDNEIREIDDVTLGAEYFEEQATEFARAIEQALRNKNGT